MLKILTIVGALLLSPSLFAANQTSYISDDVFIYLHGGPGTQFRILGSVEAGQKITSLGEVQGDYSKIIDHKGREGWVQTKLLSASVSLREQLPVIQAELAQTKADLTDALSTTDASVQELSQIKTQLAQAQKALASTSQERDSAQVKLASMQKNERFEMWKQGGFIAAGGLILGIILVYLPRPQRKPKNHW
ncbi:TIGR04211 family SH3 domain-containing protein [Shewanella sp. KX20019]|uniref:TIGR04211 family SH3 domain-containing protein n=1 Tax=Shewanella sp. KX20019 TaxID=2803864 RepID=UPI0019275473|nr:TIGR04211 family SH3 domain-containing protein [Shewanella sp. KX20019]QQX79486.1 TIGR04211 family SH3 domain-containing protein [Shewanella sp. KX20019]